MNPRRSSRPRSSQQPPPPPNQTNSSTSTGSGTKGERNTRSNNHTVSPSRPSTHRSESADDGDAMSRSEPPAPRRSKRNGEERDPVGKQQDDDEEVEGGEEEVTRCICGQAEYPGPSASMRDQQTSSDPLSDDTGNFFVQCDNCGVWQHGGCMGLTDESMLPDEYYCEQCKPEYHKILKGVNGLKSSRYLPVPEHVSQRSSSLSSNMDPSRKKDVKSKQNDNTKRRATMNSRGAYDEDEMLRRAIEESKETGSLGKRTRDDSDDQKQSAKRQRTGSSSPSTGSKHSQSPPPDAEDASARNSVNGNRNGGQKLRGGAVARTNREKELREKQKEQQAAQRAEAVNKRNARSERRRGDESPPPTPSLSPSKTTQSTGASSKAKTETPPSSKVSLNRKTGRPPARRGRLGRNQYTRDLFGNGDGSDTPRRDASHDINGSTNSPSRGDGISGESGRSSKAKTHPARTSMNEMKRRVAAILEFVGHMQTERGPHPHSSGSSSSKGANTPNGVGSADSSTTNFPTASLIKAVEAGLKDTSSKDGENGTIKMVDEREFATMDSIQMMEALTRELVQWQSVYGVYSR